MRTMRWLVVLLIVALACARVYAEVRVESAYRGEARWIKAQLHCHTTESDGRLAPAQVLQWYKDLGFEAVAITDHNRVTVAPKVPEGLVVIPGVEKSTNEGHMVLLGVSVVPETKEGQAVIEAATRLGGLVSLAHPAWTAGYSKEELDGLHGYSFVEVFNEVVRPAITGTGWAGAAWDYLLTQGQRVWGMAVDDLHGDEMSDMARGFVMVNVAEMTASGVLARLAEGNFYATTGLLLEQLRVEGARVTARVAQPSCFHWQAPTAWRCGTRTTCWGTHIRCRATRGTCGWR